MAADKNRAGYGLPSWQTIAGCCRTAPSRSTSGVMWPDCTVPRAAVLAMKFSAIGKIAGHASQGNGAEGVPLCAAVFACSANTWERIALFFSRLAKNIPSLSVASGNTMSKICSAVPCSASLSERSASRTRDQGQGPSWRKLPSSISIRTRRRSGEVLAIRRQTQSPENSSAD